MPGLTQALALMGEVGAVGQQVVSGGQEDSSSPAA